jgi:hypothetical protein
MLVEYLVFGTGWAGTDGQIMQVGSHSNGVVLVRILWFELWEISADGWVEYEG